MDTNTIDTAYQQMELFCLQQMQRLNMPASVMTYVVARLLATVESMHICEKSQTEQTELEEQEIMEANEDSIALCNSMGAD